MGLYSSAKTVADDILVIGPLTPRIKIINIPHTLGEKYFANHSKNKGMKTIESVLPKESE